MAAITRLRANEKKVIIMIVLITILVLQSLFCKAQSLQKNERSYKGFETSFGVRSFDLQSDIMALKDLSVIEEGGRVGVLWGNKVLLSKLGAGFYYSACSVPQTIDVFESDLSVNFYPLGLLSNQKSALIEPYITAGVIYGIIKFSGTYLDQEAGPKNYSVSKENYLGNSHQLQTYIGTGIEYRLSNDVNFVHFYSELNYGIASSAKTQYADFNYTSAGNQLIVNLGIRFGVLR